MTQPEKTSGFLDKIGEIAADKILPKLVELLWPKLEEFFVRVVLPKVTALIPLAVAAGIDKLAEKIPGVEAVGDVIELANDVRDNVNVAVPDFDIPVLSEIFDLTEWFNKGK